MRRLINRRPDIATRFGLMLLPFVIALVAYMGASEARLSVNPNDKLLPGWSSISAAIDRMAFQPDQRTGNYLLWTDTMSSLQRLGIGVAVATLIGGIFGILQGLIPHARAPLSAFTGVLSMIPPLALLPILFIVFGLGELSKVVLVAMGIAPFIIRDLALLKKNQSKSIGLLRLSGEGRRLQRQAQAQREQQRRRACYFLMYDHLFFLSGCLPCTTVF